MIQTELDVLIIPGLAFDSNGHRLGRGKGYYDSYISAYKIHSKKNSISLPVLGNKFHHYHRFINI